MIVYACCDHCGCRVFGRTGGHEYPCRLPHCPEGREKGEEAVTRATSLLVVLSARKAAAVRFHGKDSPEALKAAAALRLETLRVTIADALAEQPPMDEADRAGLAALLTGEPESGDHVLPAA